jgi:TolA-binding protein
MMKIVAFLIVSLMSVSCIKTAEQVQRERRLESMSEQMKDSQGLVADMVAQMKDMQAQMDKLNGRLEELEHKQKKLNPETISKMNETLSLVQTQQQAQGTQLQQIQNELKEQRGFIEKVTQSLSQAAKAPAKAQKKNAKTELNEALELVKDNKYAEAKAELESFIDHPELTLGDQNKVIHGLGRAEFYTKNYEKALVYFSKVYSKYPKSSLAPSSLFFIGKSLASMGKTDESKEAFKKVLEDYPSSKEASQAKKEL